MGRILSAMAAVLFVAACQPMENTPAEPGELDRTTLPIVLPEPESITEQDARNAETPARVGINAPEGAPNVVIVLIDDIGFGATETFGGRIKTPTFQRLAENGLRFNQFHTTALCSPTRVALKSGRNHHHANTGSVMEIATGFPGNTGEIPPTVAPLAEMLRLNGYSTAAFGKWHETATWETSVSGPTDRWPTRQGFDKFYGFIGGETNQWDPVLTDGMTPVDPNITDGYHVTTDFTNEAIEWVKFQQSMTPEKPFFVYYATGAVHAPHHVPQEWIDMYKGTYDDGWDELREKTLAKQKEMGVVPENTVLAPKPEDIKDWESLSEKEKSLFLLQVETYAGFMSHTDNEVGRLVSAIDEIGEMDNTLIIYIMGDNGTSAEGGMEGTFNELVHLNGLLEEETVDEMLSKREDWGGPESFPHMAAGWAVATGAPFSWTKQVGSDFGGTRNGMVMHWPEGFKSRGEVRNQFSHVTDVAPTVLEAAKLPFPTSVNGAKQVPFDGVSMLYATDDADAATKHNTQYFEMFGNRAIYHDGWMARTIHRAPWRAETFNTIQEDVWDLYHVDEDFSLANNLAEENPEKLAELRELFEEEAIRNRVYPIDDRVYERFDSRQAGRPDIMAGRKSLTLGHGMTRIQENAFINIKNSSKTIEADLKLNSNASGIIIAQGGKFGGWAVYMKDGKLGYHYNWFGLQRYDIRSSKTLAAGDASVSVRFDYDGDGTGKGGTVTIMANGETVASGRVERTQPAVFSADETADIGMDISTQVVPEFKNAKSSAFSGRVNSVTVSID